MELTVDQILQQGIAAHKEGKLEEAEKLYKSILGLQSQHPDANHNLGVLAVSVGKLEASLPLFKTALESNRKQEQFWISYIDALARLGQTDIAKHMLEQAREVGLRGDWIRHVESRLVTLPNYSIPLLKKELRHLLDLYQKGKLETALANGLALSAQFPSDPIAPNILGAIYAALDRYKESISQYKKSIELRPDYADSYNNLGNTYGRLGNFEEARISCQKALRIKRKYPEALKNLAKIFLQLGRFSGALKAYVEIIHLAPNDFENYNDYGVLLIKLGRYDESIKTFKKSIELNPNYADSYFYLGNALNSVGRFKDAINNYHKAIRLESKTPRYYNNLAGSLKKIKEESWAILYFRKAILLRPNDIKSYINLGVTLNDLGKHKDAADFLERTLKSGVESAEGLNALGVSLKDYGAGSESLIFFQKSIALKPENPEVYFQYSIALGSLALREEAVTGYKKALKIKPNFPAAYGNLAILLQELKITEEAKNNLKYSILLKPNCEYFFYTELGQIFDLQNANEDAYVCYKAAAILAESVSMADVFLGRMIRQKKEILDGGDSLNTSPMEDVELEPPVKNLFLSVVPELIEALYNLPSLDPSDETGTASHKHSSGIRRGNMRVSKDYFFLDKPDPAIRNFKLSITDLLTSLVSGKIFISESFFNIYKSGSDAKPHHHLGPIDIQLGLSNQKYSLVYYLRAGEKTASQPGVLNLHNPDYSINPKDGQIVVFPAKSLHSASYNGSTDRVIIGINFYKI